MKSIAVYCGHKLGNNPAFANDAKKIGELFASNGIRLIFGGGNVGLMGIVASAVLDNGGAVTGISTTHVSARQEPTHQGAEIEIVDGLNERKQRMINLSDAFCILPGGIGTLNELTDILTMQQVGESKKPIFCLNTEGYWDILDGIIAHMQTQGFVSENEGYKINNFATPEELVAAAMKYNE